MAEVEKGPEAGPAAEEPNAEHVGAEPATAGTGDSPALGGQEPGPGGGALVLAAAEPAPSSPVRQETLVLTPPPRSPAAIGVHNGGGMARLEGLALTQLPESHHDSGDPDDDDLPPRAAVQSLVTKEADHEAASDSSGAPSPQPGSGGTGGVASGGSAPAEATGGAPAPSALSLSPVDAPQPAGGRDRRFARDMLGRELLDDMGHEPEDWNEGRVVPTPPLPGFEVTPEASRTPSPRGSPGQAYYGGQLQPQQHSASPHHQQTQLQAMQQAQQLQKSQGREVQHDSLMSIDQWDWKTDAPEFVPGSMKALIPAQDEVPGGVGLYTGATWVMPSNVGGGPVASVGMVGSGAGVGCVGPVGVGNPGVGGQGVPVDGSSGGIGRPADGQQLAQVRAQYEWQLRSKVDEIREHQNRISQLEIESAQMRASWEHERRTLVRQIGHYRAVLERYCIPLEEAGGATFADSSGGYFTALEPSASSSQWLGGGGGHGDGAGAGGPDGGVERSPFMGPSQAPIWSGGGGDSISQSNSLDSKMRQLNSLLQEGQAGRRGRLTGDPAPSGEAVPDTSSGPEGTGSGGGVVSTLRAMFPHATIRTGRAELGSEEVEKPPPEAIMPVSDIEARAISEHVRKLERGTGSQIDERAMRALHGLTTRDAREALQKVDELVSAQGGHCRNLSSILQSVCRKIEKRSVKSTRADDETSKSGRPGDSGHDGGYSGGFGSGGAASGDRARRGRRQDGDPYDSEESEGDKEFDRQRRQRPVPPKIVADSPMTRTDSQVSQGSVLDTPQSRRSNRSWADIQSGDEDEGREDLFALEPGFLAPPGMKGGQLEPEEEPWTPRRVERAARRGFELRRRGDNWDLKISMGSLDPPLTEAGMEKYCKWLRVRLGSFCEEHGAEPLRRCRAEVDFSHNNMTNEMVWKLLRSLTDYEVQTALLKLYANQISQDGVLALCEYIQLNARADALWELHLSHNEIDDDAALELLRTLHSQRPRYPPRRPCEGSGEMLLAPVWLRLNHNRIHDPQRVQRQAEADGISICTAWDRQACGTSKCVRGRECPLVHLYSFNVQVRRPQGAARSPAGSEDPIRDPLGDPDGNSDIRGQRRKRNRKGKKDHEDGEYGGSPGSGGGSQD